MIDANAYSQIICFAKGHFEEPKDWFKALQRVISREYYITEDTITMTDARATLLNVACKLGCLSGDGKLSGFLDDIGPHNFYKWAGNCSYIGKPHPEYDYDTAVVHKCISLIALTKVQEDFKVLIEFGPADESILPVKPNMRNRGTKRAI